MTGEELAEALLPLSDALSDANELLTRNNELLEHLSEVQYGVILALGVVAGLLLIYILIRKF